eukprot:m.633011 g.633011  ORF g.633011 m.633011 type:complete len:61 (-) comp58295_c0_seq9:177-359(-)
MSSGAIVGIAVAAFVGVILLCLVVFLVVRLRHRHRSQSFKAFRKDSDAAASFNGSIAWER